MKTPGRRGWLKRPNNAIMDYDDPKNSDAGIKNTEVRRCRRSGTEKVDFLMDLPPPEADWTSIKNDLAKRVREVRQELYGEHGGPLLAKKLRIPYRELHEYESGGAMPGHAILRLIEHTGVNPHWLLTGDGSRFLDDAANN
jgi:hypothetical protein